MPSRADTCKIVEADLVIAADYVAKARGRFFSSPPPPECANQAVRLLSKAIRNLVKAYDLEKYP